MLAGIAATVLLVPHLACGPAPYRPVQVDNRCSLRLDGVDDYLDLGRVERAHPLMLAGSTFTLSAWFLQEPGGAPYERILDKSDGALASHGYALAADPGERRIHFYVHDGRKSGDFIGASRMYRFGTWHHLAAVARRDRLEIWLDGVRDRRTSYESGTHVLPADAVTTARIGDWCHEPGREFKGWLDDVAIWNVDLTDEAIAAIHRASARGDLGRNWGPYRFSGNLVGWWRMEEGPGVDSSGRLLDSSAAGDTARPMPDLPGGNAPGIDCTRVP